MQKTTSSELPPKAQVVAEEGVVVGVGVVLGGRVTVVVRGVRAVVAGVIVVDVGGL